MWTSSWSTRLSQRTPELLALVVGVVKLLVVLAGSLLLSLAMLACGSTRESTRAAGPRLEPNHVHAVTTANGGRSVVVACASAVYGQLAAGWRSPRQGALVAGPIAWVALSRVLPGSKSMYAPSHGLAPAVKALAVVNPGRGVTVSVPVGERGRLSLDYTSIAPRSQKQGLFRVSDGASVVKFKPCPAAQYPGGRTQFAGGFIVSGAQCAELDIQPVGSPTRTRRNVSFGTPPRSCARRS